MRHLRRRIRVLQIIASQRDSAGSVVVGFNRFAILIDGAVALSGGIEDSSQLQVTPHLNPLGKRHRRSRRLETRPPQPGSFVVENTFPLVDSWPANWWRRAPAPRDIPRSLPRHRSQQPSPSRAECAPAPAALVASQQPALRIERNLTRNPKRVDGELGLRAHHVHALM